MVALQIPLHFAGRGGSSSGGSGCWIQGLRRQHLRGAVGEVHWVERGAVESEEVEALGSAVGILDDFILLRDGVMVSFLLLLRISFMPRFRFFGLKNTNLDKLELAVAGVDGGFVLTWIGLELAAVDGDGE